MTQSDTSGQDGPARRGNGQAAGSSTTTTDKPDSPDKAQPTRTTSESSGSSSSADGGAAGSSAARKTPSSGSSATSSTRSTSSTPAGSGKSAAGADIVSRASSPRGGKDRPADSARKPRRAQLRLTQVDAWTVLKTSFLLSIALGIVSVVAVAVIWFVLGVAGVFDSLNDTIQTLLGNDFRIQDYLGTGRVLGFTMIFAVVNVVLLTAIGTLSAFLYNLSATLLGGVEVTLTEDR